jgi:hypothetical protein
VVGICLPREWAPAHGGAGAPPASMDRMAKRAVLIAVCGAAGIGLAGLQVVLTQAKGQVAGSSPPGAGWWRAALLLALGFLAAGPWLAWRAADHRSGPGPAGAGRPSGWGMLLSPVLGLIVVLLAPWYGLRWTVPVALLLTVGLLSLAPAAAAGLATVGLIAVGLVVVAFAVHPPPAIGGSIAPLHPYAHGLASWPPLAALATAEGTAILAFGLWLAPRTFGLWLAPRTIGLWLAPRTIGLHGKPLRPDAALADRVEQLAQEVNELRDLVRGGCPRGLPDRGLGDAVRALALDSALRTETDIDLPGRLEPAVEAACYDAVAEALGNAVSHSGARLVQIAIGHSAGRPPSPIRSRPAAMLRITVTDDGIGGADPARGTGLQGVERRLGALDGILAVSSPPGGPTMIIMEVPCALSAQTAASR